jgi:hypothetical protein
MSNFLAIVTVTATLMKTILAVIERDVPLFTLKQSDMKTAETQQKKEVRINIGRVEIKASKQTFLSLNPNLQGFDDYLMMRVYLERNLFLRHIYE